MSRYLFLFNQPQNTRIFATTTLTKGKPPVTVYPKEDKWITRWETDKKPLQAVFLASVVIDRLEKKYLKTRYGKLTDPVPEYLLYPPNQTLVYYELSEKQ